MYTYLKTQTWHKKKKKSSESKETVGKKKVKMKISTSFQTYRKTYRNRLLGGLL